jgi:elongator complex protein 2
MAFTCKTTIALTSAVSSIEFLSSRYKNNFILAAGEDSGAVSIHRIATNTLKAQRIVTTDPLIAPSKTITQLSWRPVPAADVDSRTHFELAVASEDISTRIYAIYNILS